MSTKFDRRRLTNRSITKIVAKYQKSGQNHNTIHVSTTSKNCHHRADEKYKQIYLFKHKNFLPVCGTDEHLQR